MSSIYQEKKMPQGLFQCELGNNYIVNLRVIRIWFNFLIISCHTDWRSWAISVSIITLRNEEGKFFHYSWHQRKRSIGTVSGQCWKYQSCSEYSHLLDILLQKKALPLTPDSLNQICSPLVVEGMFSMFETVLHYVRYINNTGKLNISD